MGLRFFAAGQHAGQQHPPADAEVIEPGNLLENDTLGLGALQNAESVGFYEKKIIPDDFVVLYIADSC